MLLAALASCGLDGEGGLLAPDVKALVQDQEEASESLAVAAALAALPSFALSSSTATLSDAVAAQETLETTFPDPGCLAVTANGNEVTYTFTSCSGPLGRIDISGQEIAEFAPPPDAGGFRVDLSSSGLTIDGRPATHGGTADVEILATTKLVAWTGAFETTSAAGTRITAESDLDIAIYDDGSASLDGTATLHVGLRGLTADCEGLTREGRPGRAPPVSSSWIASSAISS